MATTRFYLDLRGKAKDGKGNVLLMISHNFTNASISTGIRILPSEWNAKEHRVEKGSCAAITNANLSTLKSGVDKKIALLSMEDRFQQMTAADIKREISSNRVVKAQKHLLSKLFEEYIGSGDLKEGTKTLYRTTLNKVLEFGGNDLTIEDLSLKWLRAFDSYMAQTQQINGRSVYMRNLRAVCNYANHTGITTIYPFENFHIKQEETRKRNISVEAFREFYNYPTSDINARYRDYFFLSFFLIGINTKDLLLAKKSQITKGRLEYIREKTKRKYSIKIEPEASTLLEKYAGKGDNLLEAMDHCVHYQSFAREINEAIQTIGPTEVVEYPSDNLFDTPRQEVKLSPLIPGITTYFARHTWATFAYEIGIQMDVISQALGHSFGHRTTLIYVNPSQSRVDEANRRVIDYFMNP